MELGGVMGWNGKVLGVESLYTKVDSARNSGKW